MLLAIVAFSLSLLGTFLVRSGVLTSVHAFATDPERGVFILAFLVHRDRRLARAVRLARAEGRARRAASRWCRANRCCSPTTCCWSSRCGAVLLGTLYPLLLDALGLGKISVGPPYFDTVFVPLMAPARVPDGRRPARALEAGRAARARDAAALGAGASALVTALLAAVLRGRIGRRWSASACCWRCWIVAAIAADLVDRLRRPAAARGARALRRCRARYCGMLLAHLGVAVFIVGVTLVQSYEVERDVRMQRRRHDRRRRLRVPLRRRARRARPELRGGAGDVDVSRNGRAGRRAAPGEAHLPRAAACR